MASTGDIWRLGRRPALDGLRGVAVLMVVVSHLTHGGRVHNLGPVGVVAFFTLSGFLITSLLLEEHQRSGRVAFGRFYARRARRLLPAMLACVAVVAAVGVLVPGFVPWSMVAGALTYSTNWLMLSGAGVGSALSHFWSLAIEEQFYLVWPVLLVGLVKLSRRWQLVLLSAALAVAVVVPLGMGSWARIYYGFDTRSAPLLAGCLLAVAMHQRPERASRPPLAAAGIAALFAAALPGFVFLIYFAPMVAAAATVAVIWASAQGAGVRWLEAGWLTLVGRRSYGLYLWHWPAIVLANRILGDPGPWVLAVTAVPAAWALALLSWRFVEAPFTRSRKRLPLGPVPPADGLARVH